jgi:putative heme-binding domain-containing protein
MALAHRPWHKPETVFGFLSKNKDTLDMSRLTANERRFVKATFEKYGLAPPADNANVTQEQFVKDYIRVQGSKAVGAGYMEVPWILGELDSKHASLRETAWWIAGRHPEWGGQLAGYFAEQLKRADKLSAEDRIELIGRLVKFAGNAEIQKAIASALTDSPKSGKLLALHVIARSGQKAMPDVWKSALTAAAKTMDDRELVQDALEAIRRVPVTAAEFEQIVNALPRAALWPAGVVPDDYRLAILSARPPATPIDKSLAEYLVSKVRRDVAPEQRGAAVEALTRAAMTPEELIALTGALGSVSPFDLARLLPIYAKSKDQKVGLALITALTDPKVRPAIRVEQVKPILDKYPKPVRDEAEKLYALLAEARKDETVKLERLVKELPAGDVRRGQVVFNGTKAQCAACHKIGYKGGLVGPDLTRIGNIRTERDLLESIVFPSASFVRSYEPVRIVTLDGRTFSGILKSETPDEVVLTIAADKEERIPRADVESMTPSSVSVMPAGLDQQLSSQELADLVAFLKASK